MTSLESIFYLFIFVCNSSCDLLFNLSTQVPGQPRLPRLVLLFIFYALDLLYYLSGCPSFGTERTIGQTDVT